MEVLASWVSWNSRPAILENCFALLYSSAVSFFASHFLGRRGGNSFTRPCEVRFQSGASLGPRPGERPQAWN